MTAGRLAGRPVLITGGASGIGEAVARRFAGEGAIVMVADIRAAAAEKVVSDIREAGGASHFRHTDVTDRADVRRMVQDAGRILGGLDVLVNNAMADPSADY